MSEMVYMYGFGFGGPPGRNVTVHVTYGGATGSGANVSCTNRKKTFYGFTDTNGNFTFKLAKGRWTITADKSGSTSSVNVDITGDCTVNVSLFAATINVTYPAGSTCTAKNGTTTLAAQNTRGTWKFVVPNAGAWTVSCTNGKYTANSTVSITSNGQNSTAKLSYDFVIFRNGKFENGFGLEKLSASDSPTPAEAYVSNGLITMGGWGERWGFKLNHSVNLKGYSTVRIKLAELYINNHATLMVGSDPRYGSSGDAWLAMKNGTTQYRLDVSNINSKKYIFSETFNNVGSTKPAVVKISEIILMR